jgi:aryl-alcohol dehydrogenase-like predicted oxidoreductase
MNYRPFGRTGLQVSPLVLGTDNFVNPTPRDECFAILDMAVDAGINLIDTSNSYAGGEAERIIGSWLADNGKRDQVMIATKVFYPSGPGVNDRGLSRSHIMRACEASLKRLGVETIDLYQTHRPDLDIPQEETLRAFDDLVTQGKVRYIGSSTAPAWHLVESLTTSLREHFVSLVSEQSPYNLLDRRIENELIPVCQRYGMALFTWSPLAMGMLAGRYTTADAPPSDSRISLRGGIYAERVTEKGVELGNRVAALARAAGYEPAQFATAWVKDQPGVTAPIIGPRTVAQIKNMLPVLEMSLSQELREQCDLLSVPGSVTASFFNSASWMRWKHA